MQIDVEKLDVSPEMLRKLLALQKLPETELHAHLSKIFRDAENFQKFHSNRHSKAQERAIRWGQEYHTYLQKHLTAGLRQKTAKIAARKDFIAAHPLDNENGEYPGTSAPSLRYYHKAYLKSLRSIPTE